MLDLKPPALRPFCTLEVEAGAVRSTGKGRAHERRIVTIAGGRVHGPGISGTILPGGADWQTVGSDGVVEMNARYAFETADGAIIEIFDRGYRHGPADIMQRLAAREIVPPESYSMRSTMRLETGHPDYLWLNRMIFVCTGARTATGVQIDLYSVE